MDTETFRKQINWLKRRKDSEDVSNLIGLADSLRSATNVDTSKLSEVYDKLKGLGMPTLQDGSLALPDSSPDTQPNTTSSVKQPVRQSTVQPAIQDKGQSITGELTLQEYAALRKRGESDDDIYAYEKDRISRLAKKP